MIDDPDTIWMILQLHMRMVQKRNRLCGYLKPN